MTDRLVGNKAINNTNIIKFIPLGEHALRTGQIDWKFRQPRISRDRLERLTEPIEFGRLLEMIIEEMEKVTFRWKKGDVEAKGCHRAEFRFGVSRNTCDVFFNGMSGYRAQYYRAVAEGNDYNRMLLNELTQPLVQAAPNDIDVASVTTNTVRSSLEWPSAKVWIDEDTSSLNCSSLNTEALIAIEVPHWVKAATAASAAMKKGRQPFPKSRELAILGVQAPEGCWIVVFGAWIIDRNGAEFRVPSKRNRGRHIRVYGYS